MDSGLIHSILPIGYTLLSNVPIGVGTKGTVFLVQFDNVKYVLKYNNVLLRRLGRYNSKCRLTKTKNDFYKNDIALAQNMHDDFNNPMEARLEFTETNVPVVIKTYIHGPRLKDLLDSGIFFENDKYKNQLIKLLSDAADSKKIYLDFHPNNLIWNDMMWVVVDAKNGGSTTKISKAFRIMLNNFLDKLSVYDLHSNYTTKKNLYEFIGKGKYIPTYNNYTYRQTLLLKQDLKSIIS